MKSIFIIWICFVGLFLTNCSTLKVRSTSDPNADFSEYSTWCWMNDCNPTFEGPAYLFPEKATEDLVNAIASELYEKGYEQQDDQSDLLLDFHVVFKEDSASRAVVHEEALPMWEQFPSESPYYHFLEGTLVIDIADRKKGQIIWRSITKSYLPKYPDMTYEEVRKGIKKALKKLPNKVK